MFSSICAICSGGFVGCVSYTFDTFTGGGGFSKGAPMIFFCLGRLYHCKISL